MNWADRGVVRVRVNSRMSGINVPLGGEVTVTETSFVLGLIASGNLTRLPDPAGEGVGGGGSVERA